MASVEILDESVVVMPRALVAAVLADRRRWAQWWPGLQVTVAADRGPDGMAWTLTGVLVGTTAVALVDQGAAVLVRYSLSADPTAPGSPSVPRRLPDSPRGRRELQEIRTRHMLAWKRTVWSLPGDDAASPAGRAAGA